MQLCGDGSHEDAGGQRVAGQCTPRAPVSLRAAAMPLLRKCSSSAQEDPGGERAPPLHQDPGGERASFDAFPTMNNDTRFVPILAWAGRWSRGRRRGISGGSFAAPSLFKQHHVPVSVGITRHSQGLPVATGTQEWKELIKTIRRESQTIIRPLRDSLGKVFWRPREQCQIVRLMKDGNEGLGGACSKRTPTHLQHQCPCTAARQGRGSSVARQGWREDSDVESHSLGSSVCPSPAADTEGAGCWLSRCCWHL